MTITERMMDNKLILTLSGHFDFQARTLFREAIRQAQATNHRDILLNLVQVSFIDSAALGLLALTHQKLQLTHQHLVLVAPQGYVLKTLELADIHKMMPIAATEQEVGKTLDLV